MSISNETIKKLYNSICKINGDQKTDGGVMPVQANGIFLSPFDVLTSLHCVSSIDNLVFTNVEGKTSSILHDGNHKENTDLDIAVVELEDPIGFGHITVLQPNAFPLGLDETYLVARFQDRYSKHHPVELDMASIYDANGADQMTEFFSRQIQIGPGFSGAPIVNREGRVISVLFGGLRHNDPEKRRIFDENFLGTNNVIMKEFKAPHPLGFAKFMREYYFDADAPEL